MKFLALALLLLQDPPARHDIKPGGRVETGQKYRLAETTAEERETEVSVAGEVVTSEKHNSRREFEAVSEILSAADGKSIEERWSFSKALRTVEGKEVAYGFQGGRVKVRFGDRGERTLEGEDGLKLTDEDRKVLREAFAGKPGGRSPHRGGAGFLPKTPLAVGETWTPDLKSLADDLAEQGRMDVDVPKASGTGTLKSVAVRDGATFGQLSVALELPVLKMGPMNFDTPLPVRISAVMDVCIDGSRPDGEASLTMETKGSPAFEVPRKGQGTFKVMIRTTSTYRTQRVTGP